MVGATPYKLFLRVPWVNKQLASSDFTFRKRQKVAGVKYDEKWCWENILAPFFTASQCCGSGSGIRDWVLFDPWIQDPGFGIRDGRKSASGSGIRDEQPGSYFFRA
jgi:hypothetical protein